MYDTNDVVDWRKVDDDDASGLKRCEVLLSCIALVSCASLMTQRVLVEAEDGPRSPAVG